MEGIIKNDILQYSVDVRNPIDEETIVKALESYGIEVLGASYCAAWHDEDYWKCKQPYDSM